MLRTAIALLLLAASSALAQPEVVDWVALEIAPFPEAVRPLQSPILTTFTARASCLLVEPGPSKVVIMYTVVEAPAWATSVISPATDAKDAQSCDQTGALAFEGQLIVTANDQAPALTPAPIVMEATSGTGERQQSQRATVNVTAAYFSILDVQLAESIATMAPGTTKDFTVRVTNFGNGETRVVSTIVQDGDRVNTSAPMPVTLESRQAGGTRVAEDLVFRVVAPPEDGFVNRVTTINARITSAYAKDEALTGDESSVSFLVTIRTGAGAEDGPSTLPLGWLVVPLSLGAASALRGRRHR